MRALTLGLTLSCLAAAPAAADVPRAVDEVLLPGIAAFVERAGVLAQGAAADCRPAVVLPLYAAAREAWGAIGDFRLGPTESAALTIAFWPDDRSSGLRALRAATSGPLPVADRLPASARGFPALDLMLGAPELDYAPGSAGCAVVTLLAADLAAQAAELERAWADYAHLLRSPGGSGNLAYLDTAEALRALYTQALAALDLTHDARLGRPLGEPAQPRPTRAEAWRTGQSLSAVLAAARGAHALAAALADHPLPQSDAALARVEAAADAITDPGFRDITDLQARLRLEVLQQQIGTLRAALVAEIGDTLGIAPGFNALDGD